MIAGSLQQKIGDAMKAGDLVRVSTLRMLSSSFNYEKIEKQHELSDEEELAVIAREAKKRKEAIESYKSANAPDRVEAEEKELAILEEFLPEQLSDTQLEKLVDEAIGAVGASKVSDMGRVIGMVKQKTGAAADGGRISQLVKQKLLS